MEDKEEVNNETEKNITIPFKVPSFLKSLKSEHLLLGFILTLAITFRLIYSAEGVMAIGGRMSIDAFKLISGTYDPNTVWFHVGIRYVHLAIIGILFFFFGITERVLLAQPFVTSILTVGLIYIIGKKLFNKQVGLLAAFLLAIYPTDIFNATILESDSLMALFTGIAMFIYYIAVTEKKKGYWFLISGLFIGIATFTKIFALLVIPSLALYELFVVRNFNPKRLLWVGSLFIAGFLLIALPLGVYQYSKTGDILYNVHVEKNVLYSITQFKDWPIQYTDFPTEGDLLGFPKFMFKLTYDKPWKERYRTNEAMLNCFFFILIVALIYYGLKKRKEINFLIMWAAFPFLFLELYWFMGKLQRYLTIIAIPILLIVSFFCYEIYNKTKIKGDHNKNIKKILTVIILLFFVGLTIFQLGNYELKQKIDDEPIHTTEELVTYIINKRSEKDVYITTYKQLPVMNFYFEFSKNYTGPMGIRQPTPTSFYDLHFVKDLNEIEDAYVIIQPFWATHEEQDFYGYYPMTNGSIQYLLTAEIPGTWQPMITIPGTRVYYAPMKGIRID